MQLLKKHLNFTGCRFNTRGTLKLLQHQIYTRRMHSDQATTTTTTDGLSMLQMTLIEKASISHRKYSFFFLTTGHYGLILVNASVLSFIILQMIDVTFLLDDPALFFQNPLHLHQHTASIQMKERAKCCLMAAVKTSRCRHVDAYLFIHLMILSVSRHSD